MYNVLLDQKNRKIVKRNLRSNNKYILRLTMRLSLSTSAAPITKVLYCGMNSQHMYSSLIIYMNLKSLSREDTEKMRIC